jgi:hypothetical protein
VAEDNLKKKKTSVGRFFIFLFLIWSIVSGHEAGKCMCAARSRFCLAPVQ